MSWCDALISEAGVTGWFADEQSDVLCELDYHTGVSGYGIGKEKEF